jgi:rod shape-determining protein MreC
MLKQKNYVALGAVLLVAFILLSLPTRVTARFKLAAGSWFLPLFGLAGAAQQIPADLADSVLPRRELLKQIANLRTENQQLKSQAIQNAAIARENDKLHALLGWQQTVPWKLKLANVVMRDPANWWFTVQIDVGSRDGVRENLPVVSESGFLVGRVSSVSLTRSQIVLLGDPNCRVSATVENAARDMGVVKDNGPIYAFDTTMVTLTFLASGANLKPGQNVVTSGYGTIFPKAIPIGQIVDSRSVEFGLYTEARVKLAANLGSLEQVWVLFP